ncbi:MAG: GNAT family N-acetyltransferase, partial [Myxococcota bacterium]|nr:GNAT family N-acetyltransferase [Myxococcota bacterium]
GVATAAGGWTTHHLEIKGDSGEVEALCPLYLREDAEGEYLWYEPFLAAAMARGIPHSPRAVVAVPWTPVPGQRILTEGSGLRRERLHAVADALLKRAEEEDWASIHLVFCAPDEEEAFVERGFFPRRSYQFQWVNHEFADFDDFLASLSSSRRNKIRRERKELRAAGVSVDFVTGSVENFANFYARYSATAHRNAERAPPLPERFFEGLARHFSHRVEFADARLDGELIGQTLNLRKDDTFYGRYWGSMAPPRFLHFEVALYSGIEHCIAEGLQRFDPGHGGEHKALRGFDPVPVHSAHWFAEPRLHEAGAAWSGEEARWMHEQVFRDSKND